MTRKYTAQEMREMATEAEVIEVADQFYGHDMDTIAAMLRQAADLMEREKKREKRYEYATKWDDGKIDGISPCKDEVTDSISFVQYISSISADDQTGCKLVRREVGEWEVVPSDK